MNIEEQWKKKIIGLSKMVGNHSVDKIMQFEGICNCDDGYLCKHRAKWLKDFIQSLLDQQRQEIIEVLESDEIDYVEHGRFIDRNQAISKIKEME